MIFNYICTNRVSMVNFTDLRTNITERYPFFAFAIEQARHKRQNLILFILMFVPTLEIIALLNLTSKDYSGGGYWIWYYNIYFNIFLFFLTSVVSLLVATGMYRDEINDETIVYIITKPVSRVKIFFEKYIAYIVISIVIVTPGILVYHIVGDIANRLYDKTFQLSVFFSLYNLFIEIMGMYFLIIGLGAVFITTGLWLKRPMLLNLIIAFGIILEQFFLDLISNRFEPIYIAQNYVANKISGFTVEIYKQYNQYRLSYFGYDIGAYGGLFNLFVIVTIILLLGVRIARNKQFE